MNRDTERADAFLWEHQCLKAQQKARPRALTAMDFDDLSANMELPVDLDDDAGAGGGAGLLFQRGWGGRRRRFPCANRSARNSCIFRIMKFTDTH